MNATLKFVTRPLKFVSQSVRFLEKNRTRKFEFEPSDTKVAEITNSNQCTITVRRSNSNLGNRRKVSSNTVFYDQITVLNIFKYR